MWLGCVILFEFPIVGIVSLVCVLDCVAIPAKVRNSRDVRQLAEEALQHMVAPELMRAAVTADYTIECLQFLRSCFDIEDPDPATVFHCVEKFDTHMKALFVEGYILSKPASSGEHHPAEKTASQMVFEEIESAEPKLGMFHVISLLQT